MKRYTLVFYMGLLALGQLILAGCAKDHGNYDYKALNTVKIDSIANFTLMKFDPLKISPVIAQKEKTEGLTYEWKIYSPKTGKTKVLSTSRDLDIRIEEAPSVDAYEMIFKVTDQATQISDFRRFNVKVVTPFSEGWIILNTRGGNTDIDMLTPADRIFSEVYKETNRTSIPGTPTSVYTYYGQQEQKVLIKNSTDILQLKGDDFVLIQNYASLFYERPVPANPDLYFMKNGDSREFILNDGALYAMATNVPPPTRFGGKVPGDYRAAPFMAVGSKYPGIIYDEKGGGFLQLPSNKSEFAAFPFVLGDPFDMNNIGKTMVMMHAAPVRDHYYALFKDRGRDDFYFYAINSNGNPAVKYQKMNNVPGISQAKAFAVSATLPLIYYASGQDIYVYDIEANSARKVYSVAAGGQVAVLRMINTVLVAGLNEGEAGTVIYLDLAATGDVSGLKKKFSGFGKILDMVYKPQ